MELYYETEWYKAPPELKPSLKNQAMRFPARGANVRRLDHLNLLTSDVAGLQRFMEDALGMRTTEMIVLDSGQIAGVWVTCNNKTYDVAFTADHYGAHGRFHHATWAVDSKEEVLRAADICLEHGDSHRDRAAQARACSRPSSSTSTSPAATVSRSTTPALD